jgi:membrane glycosyltransferase
MDSATVNDDGPCDDVGLRCLPAERPGDMPEQSLRIFDRKSRPRASGCLSWLGTALRRWLVFGGALLIAGFAVYEMFLVLKIGGLTPLEIVVLALFAVNTVWISLPTVTALVGLLRLLLRRKPQADRTPLATRTALLMPLYNEDPARAGAALDAMARELLEHGEAHSFDVFILSDTTDGNIALAEEETFAALRQRLGAIVAIYYRRRIRNIAHKAGNVAEFCTRWGRAYDHFLVLDADSLMDGATIVELAHRMEKDPRAGLIQTVPRIHEGMTPIAQAQQFAASVYGPVLAAGLAWWTGAEGTYWGHNAIIRCDAFMQSAGLPRLPGAPPLGGYILSHDFVEAALLRRAGWKVVIADDLQGSYEASPSTLVDLSLRDRRWCQGNLQHARLLWTKGLHWVSRFHLLTGMFTFLSSPFWLLFIVATLALAVQNLFATPEYFSSSYTLFPLWPHLDPLRALRLFYLTLGILAVPKAFGLLYFVASPRRLRAAGPLFPFSIALELALSALVAPILMLMHCGFVMAVLGGGDSGWKPQRRGDRGLPWSTIAYRHRWHVAAGIVLTMVARTVSLKMLEWLLPAVAGLVMAIPLSIASGSAAAGHWLSKLGLLRSPLEAEPPPVRRKMDEVLPFYRAKVEQAPDLSAIVVDGNKLRRHLSMVDQVPKRFGEPIDVLEATADLKVRAAHTVEEAVSQMTAEERAFVQSAPDLLLQLAGLPRRSTSAVQN